MTHRLLNLIRISPTMIVIPKHGRCVDVGVVVRLLARGIPVDVGCVIQGPLAEGLSGIVANGGVRVPSIGMSVALRFGDSPVEMDAGRDSVALSETELKTGHSMLGVG